MELIARNLLQTFLRPLFSKAIKSRNQDRCSR